MKSFKKSCHSANLPLARRTTLDGVLLEIHICNTKLKELEVKASKSTRVKRSGNEFALHLAKHGHSQPQRLPQFLQTEAA